MNSEGGISGKSREFVHPRRVDNVCGKVDLAKANRLVVHGFDGGIVPFRKDSRDEGMGQGRFSNGPSPQNSDFSVDKCRGFAVATIAAAAIAVAIGVAHDDFCG